MNKRLLALLMVFIIVGGACVSSALIFRVQKLEIKFLNPTEYIENETDALNNYLTNIKFVKGRNIIFGVDRTKIAENIEASDPRIRVREDIDIEAKFPNKLIINVRERYPVYYYTQGTVTAILDASLRIVTDGQDFEKINDGRSTGEKLVLLAEFTVSDDFVNFDVNDPEKNSFKHFLTDKGDNHKADMLIEMAELFAGNQMYEDALNHLFEFIVQDYFIGEGRMTMQLRSGKVAGGGDIEIEIRGTQDRFAEKLALAWEVLETKSNYQPGRILVETDANNPDKIHGAFFQPEQPSGGD